MEVIAASIVKMEAGSAVAFYRGAIVDTEAGLFTEEDCRGHEKAGQGRILPEGNPEKDGE
jgi:hypothetical protein